MVAHTASFTNTNPHVRQIDPWRDGRAVANLLESAFRDEIIDENGQRLIHSLRYYGAFEALSLGLGTGFVWIEDGSVVGNASVQRNVTRGETWIIGNVATSSAHRNRGIGRAVVEACIRYAAGRGARFIALQADATNAPALYLYEKIGFQRLGEISHYLRPSVRSIPVAAIASAPAGEAPAPAPAAPHIFRKAKWSDRAEVWALTQRNVPERFMFAEAFDKSMYQLGFRWALGNVFNGNAEHWLVQAGPTAGRLIGAARTRVNFEGTNHHVELMLGEQATEQDGIALLGRALTRFDIFISKPIYAAQSHPNEPSHLALRSLGFQHSRTLVHMQLELDR